MAYFPVGCARATYRSACDCDAGLNAIDNWRIGGGGGGEFGLL